MTSLKKVLIIGTVVIAMGATSLTAFATSTYKTPAEVVSDITGRTVESVTTERVENNKTYGAIAKEANKLDEFKKATLEMKKAILAQQVADGIITQEKADEVIKALEENQELCDGTGTAKIGKNCDVKFRFNGMGKGNGNGLRNGNGQGRGNGTCNGGCGN